jgi:bacteriocin biosynthesis cyclodehydratase domain-containing protein
MQCSAALIADLLPLCDGARPLEGIHAALQQAGHAADQVTAVLEFLRGRGCFHPCGTAAPLDPLAAQIDWLASRLAATDDRISRRAPAQAVVHLPTTGVLADAIGQALDRLGLLVARQAAPDGACDLVRVHCTDWDDHASALRANQAALQAGVPTLYAALGETRARIGPFVLPGETPCFTCFHHRLRASMSFVDEFDSRVGLDIDACATARLPRSAPSQAGAAIVASLVGCELLKFGHGLTMLSLLGRVLEVDLLRYQMDASRVLRLPRCPACGIGQPHGAPTRAVRDLL